MAKENPNNIENKAEIPPGQTQAANGAPQTEATTVALTADEAAKLIEELEAQSEKLAESLAKITELEAEIEELQEHPRNAPIGNAARSFVVIKEYCGIGEGETITSDDIATINHMVKNGHWKEK